MKIAAVLLLSTIAGFGQVVPGRYVLELSGEHAARSAADRVHGLEARRAAVRQGQAEVARQVVLHGGQVIGSMDTVLNAVMVKIPDARAAELARIPGVVAVHPVRKVRAHLDHALPLHKVPGAWATLPLGQNGAGAGIKIGMLDSGISVTHPAFSAALPAVSGFPMVLAASDQQYTNAKIIVAKNYTPLLDDGGEPDADDHLGHGTGTAMTAAGGSATTPYGTTITGVAPMAYLGNYKIMDNNGYTLTDVASKAIDDAVADGMDVLNLSIGGPVLSSADISQSELTNAAIAAASQAGVIMVLSAGNDGPGATTMGDWATSPSAITVGAMSNDRALFYSAVVSGVAPYIAYPGDGPPPGQAISAALFDVVTLDPTGLACSPLPAGSATGMIVLVLRGTCTFESKVNNVAASGAAAALIYNSTTGTLWANGPPTVGAAILPAMFIENPDGVDLKARLNATPGLQLTLDFVGITPFKIVAGLSDFSSRGPSLGPSLKPDLVAVGDQIVTATESSDPNGGLWDPSGFTDTAGTSFSAPLVTGAAAVVKGARPGLTVPQYRSLLINYPSPAINNDGTATTISTGGSGMLNLLGAVTGTIAANPTSLSFGSGSSINTTVSLTLTNVGAAGDTFAITALPMGSSPAPSVASTVQLSANGSQQIPVTVNASGLAAGEYQGFLQVAGTSGPAAMIPYWFAVPGSTPANISLIYCSICSFGDSSRTNETEAIVFRIVDVGGLPFAGSVTPTVAISAGGGTIRSVYTTGDIPGTFAIDLRTGTSSMEVDITVGSITQSVFIFIF